MKYLILLLFLPCISWGQSISFFNHYLQDTASIFISGVVEDSGGYVLCGAYGEMAWGTNRQGIFLRLDKAGNILERKLTDNSFFLLNIITNLYL